MDRPQGIERQYGCSYSRLLEWTSGTRRETWFQYNANVSQVARMGRAMSRQKELPVPASESRLPDSLIVRGARVHNLKSVTVRLPHRQLIVFTGRSGSGKSSLAFDTIFAEGQRRSVQSLSTYARQFLGQFDKPDLDSIEGLCSAVAIDQEIASRNPRSTVGTVTDVYDMLRLLYSRIGVALCSRCRKPMTASPSGRLACPAHPDVEGPEMSSRAFSFNLPFGVCGECDGLGTRMEVDPDLVVPNPSLSLGQGALAPWTTDRWAEVHLVTVRALAAKLGVSADVPWRDLPKKVQRVFLESQDMRVEARQPGRSQSFETSYEGAIHWVKREYLEAASDGARERLQAYMRSVPCAACGGGRLSPAQLAVTVGGKNIAEVSALPVACCGEFVTNLKLTAGERVVAEPILNEMLKKLGSIAEVGLDYLTLDRVASTLSGGEAQRIRLATQLGTELFGLLYVFDEPTVGLHPRDTERLLGSLKRLRDQGNTVIVVEHNQEIIQAADWVVELGPGAGDRGGEVLVSGPIEEMIAEPSSVTGAYLSGRRAVPVPVRRRGRTPQRELVIHGASEHNLKDIDVSFPLGCFIAVAGVSGSGKSTLVKDILCRSLARELHEGGPAPGAHKSIHGVQLVDKIIYIDQSPIGRTPRSNPATYTGAFDQIRNLFARTPEARRRGYKAGRFSSNVAGGRCESCAGDGTIRVEMQFLADVYVPCDVCHGARFNPETLEVRYQGRTIADVLAMSVEEAHALFSDVEGVERPLHTMVEVGLDYLRLGQPATTLSGGEAQRIKLATELQRRPAGHTVYFLDEPTRGLHTEDIRPVLTVLNGLVDKGHTVIVIEHDLDVIKSADWVIELGPDGGERGGRIVAMGTPEAVAETRGSDTGRFLKKVLAGSRQTQS
jgi:excinuclease ABC subunit A